MRYGTGTLPIEIPDKNVAGVLEISESVPLSDEDGAVRGAIARPIASSPLAELAKGRESACIVISDVTRPVPNKVILPPLLETLEHAGIRREKITILIATGIHRPNEGDELEQMVGRDIIDTYRIVNHFSQKPEHHTYLGKTQNGTPVHIDTTYLESDLKITTGLIEPHLMAGYSGGRKAICPGVASIETVTVMHGPELMEHAKSAVGILVGNPYHTEATKIARMAGVDFNLNVAIDKHRQITGVFAGDMVESHRVGAEFVEKQAKVTLPAPADREPAGNPAPRPGHDPRGALQRRLEVLQPRIPEQPRFQDRLAGHRDWRELRRPHRRRRRHAGPGHPAGPPDPLPLPDGARRLARVQDRRVLGALAVQPLSLLHT